MFANKMMVRATSNGPVFGPVVPFPPGWDRKRDEIPTPALSVGTTLTRLPVAALASDSADAQFALDPAGNWLAVRINRAVLCFERVGTEFQPRFAADAPPPLPGKPWGRIAVQPGGTVWLATNRLDDTDVHASETVRLLTWRPDDRERSIARAAAAAKLVDAWIAESRAQPALDRLAQHLRDAAEHVVTTEIDLPFVGCLLNQFAVPGTAAAPGLFGVVMCANNSTRWFGAANTKWFAAMLRVEDGRCCEVAISTIAEPMPKEPLRDVAPPPGSAWAPNRSVRAHAAFVDGSTMLVACSATRNVTAQVRADVLSATGWAKGFPIKELALVSHMQPMADACGAVMTCLFDNGPCEPSAVIRVFVDPATGKLDLPQGRWLPENLIAPCVAGTADGAWWAVDRTATVVTGT